MSPIVTTSVNAGETIVKAAQKWAIRTNRMFILRNKRSLSALATDYGYPLLVYTAQGPELITPTGRHFFSLQMAQLRIQRLRRQEPDYLLTAVGLKQAGRVLDCTCGLGADAAILSFGLPAGSEVQAWEKSPELAAITAWGFQHYVHQQADVTAALRRISLKVADYTEALERIREPFDVIYFDPMFTGPIMTSSNFQPLRSLLPRTTLSPSIIQQALKKCARVVIKERAFHTARENAFSGTKIGGKYSRIQYVILKGEWKHG